MRQLSGSYRIAEVKLPITLFAFDMRLPAGPQFASAKEKFLQDSKEWHQSHRLSPPGNIRPQISKFPTYLQLLDFQSTPDKEIGSHLFPTKSGEALRVMINKNMNAARRWRDNYLLIAHYPAK